MDTAGYYIVYVYVTGRYTLCIYIPFTAHLQSCRNSAIQHKRLNESSGLASYIAGDIAKRNRSWKLSSTPA